MVRYASAKPAKGPRASFTQKYIRQINGRRVRRGLLAIGATCVQESASIQPAPDCSLYLAGCRKRGTNGICWSIGPSILRERWLPSFSSLPLAGETTEGEAGC